MYQKEKNKNGFTIIETLLAMTFLALLMLMIGYVTLHLVNVYNKGVSIRDVNKTADQIINDMQLSIANSGNIKCGLKYKNSDHMVVEDSDGYTCEKLLADDANSDLTGGAICTGKNSYVWNYGRSLQELVDMNNSERESSESKLFRYKNNGRVDLVRMARVKDESAALCSSTNLTDPGGSLPIIFGAKETLSSKDQVIELIESGDRELALHSFLVSASSPDEMTDQALYEFEFVLGTFRDKVLVTEDASCKNLVQANQARVRRDGTLDNSQKISESDLNYCAINKFNFAARAVKGKGKW